MNLPRSSSDIRLQVPCIICSGNATFGSANGRTAAACQSCAGTGWQDSEFHQLSAAQLTKLRALLPALPLDPATPYPQSDPMVNLGKLLAQRWIETVSFPKGDASAIDLIDKRGGVIRLHPVLENNSFHHINAIPIPPAP